MEADIKNAVVRRLAFGMKKMENALVLLPIGQSVQVRQSLLVVTIVINISYLRDMYVIIRTVIVQMDTIDRETIVLQSENVLPEKKPAIYFIVI